MSEYIIYLRKSRQDDPNETVEEVLEKHERILQEYALKNIGYRIRENDIYREVVSGEYIDDRPMIQALYKRLEEENDIKGVLVVEPQRLTRGDLLDCGITVRTFKYTDTIVMTPTKSYNLNDKFDRKLFEMELSRGSDYLEYTKEILKRGREASIRKGNYIGSEAPYGYEKVKIDKNWTLKPNEKEMPYVQMAFQMYLDGVGTGTIAFELDRLGAKPRRSEHMRKTTIVQMLKNPVYIGKLKMNSRPVIKTMENGKVVKKRRRSYEYEIIDGIHEPIISEELFYNVQEKFKQQTTKERKDVELQFLYAGIMKCTDCHKAVRFFNYEKYGGKPYIRGHKNRIACTYKKYCGNIGHNFIDIHNAIICELKRYLKDFEVQVDTNAKEDRKNHEMLLKSLLERLEENHKKMDDICDYLENGVYTVDMFIKRKQALEDEKETIEKAIEIEKENVNKDTNIENKVVTLHKALEMLDDDSISTKTKNQFLKSFIEVIYFGKKGTQDDYKITLGIILK